MNDPQTIFVLTEQDSDFRNLELAASRDFNRLLDYAEKDSVQPITWETYRGKRAVSKRDESGTRYIIQRLDVI